MKELLLIIALIGYVFSELPPELEKEYRIIGGMEVDNIRIVPWQVSIQKDDHHVCGGIIIDEENVLTAAHCVEEYENFGSNGIGDNLKVRYGDANWQLGKFSLVRDVYIHPDYNNATHDSDVAILWLKTKIIRGTKHKKITLVSEGHDPEPYSSAIVTGWGATKENAKNNSLILRAAMIPIIDRNACKALNSGYFRMVNTNMICAGFLAGEIDSCEGDSGGPLYDANTEDLIGIVSWGIGCARQNAPHVYTRIGAPSIRKFIKKNAFV